jgi:hypothetical protein
MNHIYQRYLKLSMGLVEEARQSWQQHSDPECREVLFQRYMDLTNEMETLDFYLSKRGYSRKDKTLDIQFQGERPPIERFDFKQPLRLPQRTINLQAMLRHSSEGVVA